MPGKHREEVDIGRITQWIRDPFRKPAQVAFTEGPERQIAYAVGDVLLPLLKEALMAVQAQKFYEMGLLAEEDADRLAEALQKVRREPPFSPNSFIWSEINEVLMAHEKLKGGA